MGSLLSTYQRLKQPGAEPRIKINYKTYEEFKLEYDSLMVKSQLASLTAAKYLHEGEFKLVTFYYRVSECYRLRALNLDIVRN